MAYEQDRIQDALGNRYHILREIGRGGMAVVYLAEDPKYDRRIALKVFNPDLAAVLGPERFVREISVSARLHHPHLLPLYDSGDAGGLLYYVMPYVDGESLRDRLRRERQLPIDEAIRICHEVADALAYAHTQHVVHRDIKPENILLEGGHAIVADFGIARAITEAGGDHLTGTGVAVGTPAYMSPEQASGEQELDGRTDLYSLACVLYEMLTGEPPLGGASLPVLMARKLTETPPPLGRLRGTVPSTVEHAVARALAVLPADRQRTVAEFADQIAPHTGIATPAPGMDAAAPRARRRTALLSAAAVVLVLGAAAVTWRVAAHRGAAPAAEAADRVVVLPYDNQTGDSTLAPIGRMVAEWITDGLAQTSEVHVVPSLIVMQTLAGLGAGSRKGGHEATIQSLARLTQSGVAVTGSYYRRGDTLEFHSEVLDAVGGRPLGVVGAVSGRVGDPTAAIEEVRRRVMGALATRLGRLSWESPTAARPPTYDAYRAYARGLDLWIAGDYVASAGEFQHAFALDSTYLRAVLMAVSAYGNAGLRAKSDSLLSFVLARRDRLSPYDQYRIDWHQAGRRGDRQAQLTAARAGVRLVPYGSVRTALILTLEQVNRPREALREMEGMFQGPMSEGATSWYAAWGLRTELLHILGDHEQELEVAQDARTRLAGLLPTLEYEGRALAALGKLDDLRTLIGDILAARPMPSFGQAEVLYNIAEDLRAHGHAAEAVEVTDRALEWCDTQSPAFNEGARGHNLRAYLRYLREEWGAAEAQWDSIPPDGQSIVDRLGRSGVIAARLGQPDSARAIAARLDRLDPKGLNGQQTLWQARIAALLGDKDVAVSLLRQAFGEGLAYGLWLHSDMDLEALRDYGPYRELERPKG